MFKFVVVFALIACGSAYVSDDDAAAEVKHSYSNVHENGFQYAYETSNNIKASSAGDEYGNQQGEFGWISPEGEHIGVQYVADENGYQPRSDVLPTPHPIPEAILKALRYIEQHAQAEISNGRKF